MSELIKHECGIALVRLLKPLGYYQEKYGNILYGFNKLFLLMEKQHNRGQDGAGIGCVKLDMPAGQAFMFRERDNGRNPIDRVIKKQIKAYRSLLDKGIIYPEFPQTVKEHWNFGAEILLGHLRYGTSGGYGKSVCQPYFRKSPWPTRNLMLAGNFNMTNLETLNRTLIDRGAHPIFDTDTQTVLEEMGYHLDEEHTRIYHQLRDAAVPSDQTSSIISERLDVAEILKEAGEHWDGGYALAGMIGNGDCFVTRDPGGIRPAYYFKDDEVLAVASERVALMSIFDQSADTVHEVQPGHAIVMKKNGELSESQVRTPVSTRTSCSFERIYFSRGNDPEIYQERKSLGQALVKKILKSIDDDIENSVFSYIPNTAETAYYGMMDELRREGRRRLKAAILAAHQENRFSEPLLEDLMAKHMVRGEKIAHKDIKLRTFISQEKSRIQLATHVYDITYGVVKPNDCLVCVDDSIVRGTTLKQSIFRILGRTNPRKIIIASTAPQIRYPDCYGIDMSEMGKFVAFQAAIELHKELGQQALIQEVYQDCYQQANKPGTEMVNHVKRIYEPFTTEGISAKISQLVAPKNNGWDGEVEIIYQDIDDLHAACPDHNGDWYFTGDYPTPGGLATLNRAFMFYFENKAGRSY